MRKSKKIQINLFLRVQKVRNVQVLLLLRGRTELELNPSISPRMTVQVRKEEQQVRTVSKGALFQSLLLWHKGQEFRSPTEASTGSVGHAPATSSERGPRH